MTSLRTTIAAALTAALLPASADAFSVTLRALDPTGAEIDSRTLADDDGNGAILSGGPFAGIDLVSVTAQSKPLVPTGGTPGELVALGANSILTEADGFEGALEVIVSDNDFDLDGPTGDFRVDATGNDGASSDGSATVETFFGQDNVEVSGAAGNLGTLAAMRRIGDPIVLGSGITTGAAREEIDVEAGPFALTTRTTISLTGTGDFDADVDVAGAGGAAAAAPVPLPTPLLLLMSALGGTALLRARRVSA